MASREKLIKSLHISLSARRYGEMKEIFCAHMKPEAVSGMGLSGSDFKASATLSLIVCGPTCMHGLDYLLILFL